MPRSLTAARVRTCDPNAHPLPQRRFSRSRLLSLDVDFEGTCGDAAYRAPMRLAE